SRNRRVAEHTGRHGEIADQSGAGGVGPTPAKAEAGGMNCAEMEVFICDYVDGTLAPDRKAELERHLSACPACAELARDSAAAVAFLEHAADVEPPPELITRILFDAPWSKGRSESRLRRWLSAVLGPVLTPRYAMGMAMTVLS